MPGARLDQLVELNKKFYHDNFVYCSEKFVDNREVFGRHSLPNGYYCIVPTTFAPQQEGDFLLRLFTEKPSESRCVVNGGTRRCEPSRDGLLVAKTLGLRLHHRRSFKGHSSVKV